MSLIYLATPYTNFPDGLQAAFEAAARVTADLMKRGFVVYSPICHSHPVAATGLLDAVDHELWMRIDRVMMDRCDMLAVAKLPTWESSKGVGYEIEYFHAHGKPVCYLDLPNSGTNLPDPGICDAGEFTQPPNCAGVHESTKSTNIGHVEIVDGDDGAKRRHLSTSADTSEHPMHAVALEMAEAKQPRRSESAWSVTWPCISAHDASEVARRDLNERYKRAGKTFEMPYPKPDAPQTEYQTLVGN